MEHILEYGVMAPSGDNSQPWLFQVRGDTLDIFNMPERDNPYLNYRQSGSYIAHGGLIENIHIAALHLGYIPKTSLFPGEENLVARITFEKGESRPNELFDSISQRQTNRRPYHDKPLTSQEYEHLAGAADEENMRILFVSDKKKREGAARAGSAAEIVILGDKLLHGYLFGDILWSEAEERRKKNGLYIATMEFSPPQRALFKLARSWNLMKIANALGFPRFVAREDTKLYATGAAMGLIALRGSSDTDFIEAGRVMQRVWLRASKLGLSLQPVTATLFFGQRIRANETGHLSAPHVELLSNAYDDIQSVFDLAHDEVPAMMFRIGHADPPRARCSRISPQEKCIEI